MERFEQVPNLLRRLDLVIMRRCPLCQQPVVALLRSSKLPLRCDEVYYMSSLMRTFEPSAITIYARHEEVELLAVRDSDLEAVLAYPHLHFK